MPYLRLILRWRCELGQVCCRNRQNIVWVIQQVRNNICVSSLGSFNEHCWAILKWDFGKKKPEDEFFSPGVVSPHKIRFYDFNLLLQKSARWFFQNLWNITAASEYLEPMSRICPVSQEKLNHGQVTSSTGQGHHCVIIVGCSPVHIGT